MRHPTTCLFMKHIQVGRKSHSLTYVRVHYVDVNFPENNTKYLGNSQLFGTTSHMTWPLITERNSYISVSPSIHPTPINDHCLPPYQNKDNYSIFFLKQSVSENSLSCFSRSVILSSFRYLTRNDKPLKHIPGSNLYTTHDMI